MDTNRPDMTKFEKDIFQMFNNKVLTPDTDAMWANIKPQIKNRGFNFTWSNFTKLFLGLVLCIFMATFSFELFQSSSEDIASNIQNDQFKDLHTQPNSIKTVNINKLNFNPIKPNIENNSIFSSPVEQTNKNDQKPKQGSADNLTSNSVHLKTTSFNTQDKLGTQQTNVPKTPVYQYRLMTRNAKDFKNNNPIQIPNSKNLNYMITSSDKKDAVIHHNNAIANKLATLTSPPLRRDNELTTSNWTTFRKKRGCYDFSLRKWRYEIDVYAGPDWTKKYLEPKSESYSSVVKARFNTEEYLEAFSLGAQFNVRHRSGFYASIGLNYSQIDEKFTLNQLSNDTVFQNGIIRIDIDSVGNTSEQMGEKEVINVTNWDKGTYNYYRFLSIPITVGYGFSFYGLGIEPSVGIDINFLFTRKGEILNARSTSIDYDIISSNHPKQANVFKSSAGFSGIGALKILYPYSRKMDLFAETYIRYQLGTIVVDEYPIDQKYRTIGLRLGARFKF